MTDLKHDWLTEGMIDYEYKKYILLAYLKNIREKFDLAELYPFLSDLILHYKNLIKVKENKEVIYESFPKSISKADFQKLQFTYKRMIKDDELMDELESIIAFALPKLEEAIGLGKELFDLVEENMEMEMIGLTPIYSKEGYVLVNQDASRDVEVYRYQMSVLEHSNETFRAISTTYVGNDFQDFSRSYEQIKLDLAKRFWELPNPATFLVISKMKFPLPQTVLPVAKRLLVRKLTEINS
ncbi:hypothetical protein [Marinoscillum sp.]|uniref:hypothetical protein n=1 Tax=Marinoscillum sp. TaxID=2024838 RepID=UPI003BAAA960